jgi:hypothetical protein
VFRVRGKEYQNWEAAIRTPPLVNCTDTCQKRFLQFDLLEVVDGEMCRMIGWGHHDMIHILKNGDKHVFIDCTFDCVPKGFKQLMIIMIYEPATELYLPIFHILLQSKKEIVYRRALYNCVWATGFKFKGISFSCDFEFAIIDAIKEVFECPVIVGCLFHWKKAIRQKMMDCNIPKNLISEMIGSGGLLEVLTVIPIGEIETKGIPYVRSKCKEEGYLSSFNQFWNYFKSTWLDRFPPSDWNINGKIMKDNVINRTNNPLERYNRTIASCFKVSHPNMDTFVRELRTLCNRYVTTYNNVKNGYSTSVQRSPIKHFKIPEDYNCHPVDLSAAISKCSMLERYSYLVDTVHFDPEDQVWYKVISVEYYKDNIVGNREQIHMPSYPIIGMKKEDLISVEEINSYMTTANRKK